MLSVRGFGTKSVVLPARALCLNRVVIIRNPALGTRSGNFSVTTPSGKVEGGVSIVSNTNGVAVCRVKDGTDWIEVTKTQGWSLTHAPRNQ